MKVLDKVYFQFNGNRTHTHLHISNLMDIRPFLKYLYIIYFVFVNSIIYIVIFSKPILDVNLECIFF